MTGRYRYSFDLAELGDGIGIVPVALGLFGLGEIPSTPSRRGGEGHHFPAAARHLLPTRTEWCLRLAMLITRVTLLGFFIGHHSRLGAYHFQLPVLCAGKVAYPRATRSNSARARSPASPCRRRPTTPRLLRPRAAAPRSWNSDQPDYRVSLLFVLPALHLRSARPMLVNDHPERGSGAQSTLKVSAT